jgi:isopentenyl diphosphate isomerase/L-lactate dehydrogenase-like FMN-dependent dehydrogenase
MALSNYATICLEDVHKAAGKDAPNWFQLNVVRNRSVSELIHRAEIANYKVIVLTVDAPALDKYIKE